jgi:hypothetical protein
VHLVQILLPRTRRDGAAVTTADFADTRAELVEAFEGVTAYLRSPAQGAWTAPDGHVEQDEMVMVEVLVDHFDREWWRAYAVILAARFQQESIHIRTLPAEMP